MQQPCRLSLLISMRKISTVARDTNPYKNHKVEPQVSQVENTN